MAAVVSDPDSYFDKRAKAIGFLRSFFDAIGRRDWQALKESFHPNAALFTQREDGLLAFQHWDVASSMLKRWLELPGIRKLPVRPDDLELQVSDGVVIVSLPPIRGRKEAGKRCLVLTWDGDGWQVRHLNLSRLGIDLSDLADPADGQSL
jgi:hypothetical protein